MVQNLFASLSLCNSVFVSDELQFVTIMELNITAYEIPAHS